MRISEQFFYVDNPNYIRVKKMFNPVTGQSITDAVVTATVQDAAGNPVAGVNWPVTLPFDPNVNHYHALVENMQLINKQKYLTRVDIDASGLGARFEIWRSAITRRR